MSFTLDNPFQYWNNPNNSSPIGLGKLYVGLPDTDPEQVGNRVTVKAVQPNGAEITLTQPVQLLAGGVPELNGSPVQLKIDAETVSVKVTTSTGAQVYYTERWSVPSKGMLPDTFVADLAASNSRVLVGGVEARKLPLIYNNVAEMQSGVDISNVGKAVKWLGYYAAFDGGDGCGVVKLGSYVPDGGKIIGIGSGLYVEQDISGSSLSVKKYGVRGDGVTNDTIQFQRCLNSGKPSIFAPEGVYILGPLTFPDWITVEGVGYQPSVGGGTRITELRFSITTGEAAITCGSNPVIRNLFLINVGGSYNEETKTLSGTAAAAIKLNENAVIEECGFWLWYDCIRTGVSTFYLRTSKVHFNRCTFGYTSEGTSPYDMHIDAPHSALTEVFLRGVGGNVPRNTKIFGGSIEGYSCIAQSFLDIAFFGTYFESEPERTVSAAIEPQLDESTVSLFGCTIFMNRTARFVNMSGLNRVGLTSSGNTFAGAATAGSYCFYLPDSGSVSLAGDKIESSIMTNTLYIDSISKGLKLGGIRMPLLQTGNAQVNYSELTFSGDRGAVGAALSSAPSSRVPGQMILADGSSWDPLSLSAGRPYYVIWQGDRWKGVSG